MPQDPTTGQQITLEEWERKTFERYGVPENLRRSILGQESGGDVNAKSPTGVRGRYQVTQATAAQYGYDRDDPWQQPVAAAKHLRSRYDEIKKRNPKFNDKQAWLGASAEYYYGKDAFDADGNLSAASRDGHSNPASYATSIAERWSAYDRGEDPQLTRQAQPQQQKALDQGRAQKLGELITNHEALKRQGSRKAAAELAAEIKRDFGDLMEVGADKGGWSYVKPKDGMTYDLKDIVSPKPFTPEEAEAASRRVIQKASAPPAGSFAGFVNQFAQSAIKGTAAIPEGFAENIRALPRNDEIDVFNLMIEEGMTPEQAQQALPARLAQYQTQRSKNLAIKQDFRPITEAGGRFAERVAPVDPDDQGFWSAKTPQALGSTVPFIAGTIATGGNPLTGAILGASMNAQQIAREFDDAGVDPAKRDRAVLFAGATGLTEIFGLTRTLQRFGLSRPFLRRLVDIAEEGGQEALQQFLNNVNAVMVGAYDPNRPLSRDVVESTLLGLIAGGGVQGASATAARAFRRPEGATPQSPVLTQAPQVAAIPGAQPEAAQTERYPRARPEEDTGLQSVRDFTDQIAAIQNSQIPEEQKEAAMEAAREAYRAQRRGGLSPEVQTNLAQPQLTQLGPEGLRAARTPEGAIIAPPSPTAARKQLGPATGEESIPTAPLSRAVNDVVRRPDPRFTPGGPQTQPVAQAGATQTLEGQPFQQAEQPLPPEQPTKKFTKAERETQDRNQRYEAGIRIAQNYRKQAEAAKAAGDLEAARDAYDVEVNTLSDARSMTPKTEIGRRSQLDNAIKQAERLRDAAAAAFKEQKGKAKPAKITDPNAPTAELTSPLLGQINNPEGGIPPRSERFSGLFGQLARNQERGQGDPLDNVRIGARIRQLGGIDPAGVYTGELQSAVDKKYPGMINRQGGIKPDTLREMLRDEGYPVDEDLDSLFRAIDDDIAGKAVYPMTRRRTAELERQEAEYYASQEEEARSTNRLSRTERLPVPPATAENIEELRERHAKAVRLMNDRGAETPQDLIDEEQELGAAIAKYDGEQAKAARQGRVDENAPPTGVRADDRPFAQPTREDMVRAFEAVEARLDEEIEQAIETLPKDDAEILENAVAAVDAFLAEVEQDVDVVDLLDRAAQGDTDAREELVRFAERRHGVEARTIDSILDARRESRSGPQTTASESKPEAVPARPGQDGPRVEARPQARKLSKAEVNLLTVNPADLDADQLRAHREALDRLKADGIRGAVIIPPDLDRQLEARLKQTSKLWDDLRKKGGIGPKNERLPAPKKPSKAELGRRLVEQMGGKKAEAEPTAPAQPDILQKLTELARTPTSPVQISALRAAFPELSKEQFDQAMLKLNEEGSIALHRHDHPASLKEAERNNLVRSGDDYFNAVTVREGEKAPEGPREVKRGDIIEYQGKRWQIHPLQTSVMISTVDEKGEPLRETGGFHEFSYEEFEQATGYKALLPRPAEVRGQGGFDINLKFLNDMSAGHAELIEPELVERIIAKLKSLQEKFEAATTEADFGKFRQHFALISGATVRLANQLHARKQGYKRADAQKLADIRFQLEGRLNAPDGEHQDLPDFTPERAEEERDKAIKKGKERDAKRNPLLAGQILGGEVTDSGEKAPVTVTEVSPERLEEVNLLRKWGNQWQWRVSILGSWLTSSTREGAIEQARKVYEKTPESERLTALERGERDVARDKKEAEARTVTHPDPDIDRKEIIAETDDGRVVVANPDNKGGISVVKDRSDEETDYKFSSTQVNLPPDIATKIKAFGNRIPDADLADDGREDNPHITVKFGLHGADPKPTQEALAGEKPVKVTFGKVSLFTTNDDFDVIKVDIVSDDLHRLNKKVSESQPVTDTHPGYKPHATIAYVKKGKGARFVGNTFLEGQTVVISSVTFSGRDGKKVEIPLHRPASEQAAIDKILAGIKKPWEMTRDEYVEKNIQGDLKHLAHRPEAIPPHHEQVAHYRNLHLQAVGNALRKGETVSDEVLKDYPGLRPKAAKERAAKSNFSDIFRDEISKMKAEEAPKKEAPAKRANFEPEIFSVREARSWDKQKGMDAFIATATGNRGGRLAVDGTGPTPEAAREDARRKYIEARRKQAQTAAPERTAGEAAISSAKNVGKGLDSAAKAMQKLFGGSKLSSGFTFDEQTYAEAKPHFKDAWDHFAAAAADAGEAMRLFMRALLRDYGMTIEDLERMEPYVVRFVQEASRGVESAATSEVTDERRIDEADDREGDGLRSDGRPVLQDQRQDSGSAEAGTGRVGRSDDRAGDGVTSGQGRPESDAGVGRPTTKQGTASAGSGGKRSNKQSKKDAQRGLIDLVESVSAPNATAETVVEAMADNLPAEPATPSAEIVRPGPEPAPKPEPKPKAETKPSQQRHLLTNASFAFTPETIEAIEEGGKITKFRQNIRAIETMRKVLADGRKPTQEEQEIMALYAGFGGIKEVFKPYDYSLGIDRRDVEKWVAAQKQLRELIGEEAYKSADRSTKNAHYTSPRIVEAMWKMAERFGFQGGRVLEPSMGSGNFLGLTPGHLRSKTAFTGVELDLTTGEIARLLYPDANIKIEGFQDLQVPDNFYDMAIGNVPFGDYLVADSRYSKFHASVHNYFFLKAMDKVRPGGLVMFITSTGTMDAPRADNVRKALYEQADLVDVMRFPESTFKNALTAVVTDLVILRKRLPGEKPGSDLWTKTGLVLNPDQHGDKIQLNSYLAANRGQMLGTFNDENRMHPGGANVARTDDFEQLLEAAMEALPESIMSDRTAAQNAESREAKKSTKTGAYVIEEGKLFRKQQGHLVRVEADEARIRRAEGLMQIRDVLNDLTDAEMGRTDESSDDLRKQLNKVYDQFVGRHGAISDSVNSAALVDDPDLPRLQSLEDYDKQKKIAKKRPIFSHSTIVPVKKNSKPENITQAVVKSIGLRGDVFLPMIAEDLGISEADAAAQLTGEGLAYQAPAGHWEITNQYLSGNVRQKLMDARAAAENDPFFEANVKALEAVVPPDIPHTAISVQVGAPWVEPGDISQFVAEIFNDDASNIKVHYDRPTGAYNVQMEQHARARMSNEATTTWGTDERPFRDLLDLALMGKRAEVTTEVEAPTADDPGATRTVIDPVATQAANTKLEAIKQRFREWVWEDDSRRERLTERYNAMFNSHRVSDYDASFMGDQVPGMAHNWKLRPHQMSAVLRAITEQRGLMAHEVGLGKTLAMIAAASELKRLGIASKPAIAIPKKVLPGFVQAARNAFPMMRLHVIDGHNANTRNRTMSEVATGDFDLVLMTHTNLDMLKMRPAFEAEILQKELDEVNAVYAMLLAESGAQSDAGGGRRRGRSKSGGKTGAAARILNTIRKRRENLEAKIRTALSSAAKDDSITFEDTGIDFLFVDEFHEYKSLPVVTALGQIKGVPTNDSQKAVNMLMRARYLQQLHKGGGVIAATGTPVSNTLVEAYIMSKFLQPDVLEGAGIESFDAWARNFGEVVSAHELDATGRWKISNRMSRFRNLPELQTLSRVTLDVKTAKETGISEKKPKRVDKVISIPLEPTQAAYMLYLRERAERLKGGKVDPKVDNYLVVSGDGRKMAGDIRMALPGMADRPSSKTKALVENVIRIHKAKPGMTQMIFCDIGVHPNTWGFRLYGDIIDRLADAGIPKNKIIDFSKLDSDAKVEQARNRLNSGDALVAIGGRQNMGTGVNAQDRMAAIHQYDTTWKPAMIEQSEARGWRQGNVNEEIEILSYVVEGSFDAVMWATVARKAQAISSFMRGTVTEREMTEEDGETLTYEQIAAAASGDEDFLRKAELDQRVFKLQMMKQTHDADITNRRHAIPRIEGNIMGYKLAAEQYDDLAAEAKRIREREVEFVSSDRKTYTDKAEAAKALVIEIASYQKRNKEAKEAKKDAQEYFIGTFKGIRLYLNIFNDVKGVIHATGRMRDAKYFTIEPNFENYAGTLQSFDAQLASIQANKQAAEYREITIPSLEQDLANLRKIGDTPFQYNRELEQAQAELARVNRRLRAKQGDQAEENQPLMAESGMEIREVGDLARRLRHDLREGDITRAEIPGILADELPRIKTESEVMAREWREYVKQKWDAYLDRYGLEESAMWQMARGAGRAQRAFGDEYAAQRAELREKFGVKKLKGGEIAIPAGPGLIGRLDAVADAARERIKARNAGRLTAGIDPADLADMTIIGAAKLAKGAIEFSSWAADMVKDFGEGVRSRLPLLWQRAKAMQTILPIEQLIQGSLESESWKDWYDRHHEPIEDLFREDSDLFRQLLAATSQHATVKANVTQALKAYRQFKLGEPFTGYLPGVINNLERIRRNEAVAGPKIGEYGKGMTGRDPNAMAVDMHVAEVLFGTKAPTRKQVERAKFIIRTLATKLGWTYIEEQSVLWAYNQLRQGKEPDDYAKILRERADEIRELRAEISSRAGRGLPASGNLRGRASETEGRAASAGARTGRRGQILGGGLGSLQSLFEGGQESPDQSGVRKGFVRITDPATGKTYITEKSRGLVERKPASQPVAGRAQPPKPSTSKASQPALIEREPARADKDVTWFDYLRSPLSNLNYKGTYERLAGDLGKEISEVFRQAQLAIAHDQAQRGKVIALLEESVKVFKPKLRAKGMPGLANWLDAHVAALEDPDAAFRGLAGFLKSFQYWTKLRFNPRSIVVNFLQPLQTLWPHLSTAEFLKIAAEARKPETRERLKELSARESGGKIEDIEGETERKWWDPFGKVSVTNRIMGHLAGEMMADKLGLVGEAKARMAADWNQKVEFDNSRWNVPPLFRGRLASVVGQFKPFIIKNLERLQADWKAAPNGSETGALARRSKMILAQLMIGGVRSALVPGVKQFAGVLILGALAKALSGAGMDDDDANKVAEAIYFGAPGLVEQDLSSSVMILESPFGNTPAEQTVNFAMGPTFSLLVKAWKEGQVMSEAKDTPQKSRAEKVKDAGMRLAKATTPYTKTAETIYSLAKDRKPPKLRLGKEEVEMTTPEAIGYFGMSTPLRQTKFYEERNSYDWQKRILGQPAKPGGITFGEKLGAELRKHDLDYSSVDKIDGDTDETHKARANRVGGWLKQYGEALVEHPRYQAMSESLQKAALQNLRRRLGEEANQKSPTVSKFQPWVVIGATRESAREKPGRDRRKIVVSPD